MTRPEDTKVTMVQRGKLGFVEAFDDGQDRGIDESDVSVSVPFTDLEYPRVVRPLRLDYLECAGLDVAKKCNQDARMQTAGDKVVHLGEDRAWNDE